MTFAEDMVADAAAIFTDTAGPAVAAVYTPRGGTPVDITLFEMTESVELNSDGGGEYRTARKLAAVQLSEVTNPLPKDTLTIGATVWEIDRVRSRFVIAILELVEITNTQRADEGRIKKQR